MTINSQNKKIYETVYQQKALTEEILGITNHSFSFAKVSYKAVCTDAVDFTMFDKVICGILQIDEVLNIEEIADILGLNIVNQPDEGKYIDYGEKEILDIAIKNLIDFNMIEPGDIYHSRCRLTDIGKEYAAKGKKFLPATEKEFVIFYDLNDQNHKKAEKRFGKIETSPALEHKIEFDVEDENFVKEIAKSQIPEIYNPEKLKNFTDLELQQSGVYSPDFSIVPLVSFIDKSVRYLAFDNQQALQHSISELINSDKSIGHLILEKLADAEIPAKKKSDFQKEYETKAIEVQEEMQELLSAKKVKEAFEKSKDFYLQSKVIDEFFLELHLKEFFDKESKEFWIILKDLNTYIFEKIKKIIDKQIDSSNNLFIITSQDIPNDYQEYLTECSKRKYNFFFGVVDEIDQSTFLSVNEKNKWGIFKQPFIIEFQIGDDSKIIEKDFFVKSSDWNKKIFDVYNDFKKSIAYKYHEIAKNTIEESFSKMMDHPMELSKNKIENISLQNKRLVVFKSVKELSNNIREVDKASQEKIETLRDILNFRLEEEFKNLEKDFQVIEAKFTIPELRDFEERVSKILAEVFDDKLGVVLKCKALIEKIQSEIKTLSNAQREYKSQRKKSNRSSRKKR